MYITMAYVEGVSLGERLRTRGPLLPGQAARVLREVAWALAYAHGAGIVHRDVSAENILLERVSERAIVTDFGLAGAMQTAALNATGQVMGNAHYVSPEQATGEPVDARSDLYSLGVVGYFALTGHLPFEGETTADIVAQHLSAVPRSIASVAGSVPPRLAAAVERCLHKDPIRRYRSAENFAEAIDLAFEHAKEIPAPLRSWINQGERELPARLAMIGFGAMSGVTLAFATYVPVMFLFPFIMFGGLSFLPAFTRLRRVLADGYHVDDLHAALREHQLARSEEIEYERRQGSPGVRRSLRVLLGISLGGLMLGAYMAVQYFPFAEASRWTPLLGSAVDDLQWQGGWTFLLSITGLTISGVPIIGEYIRHRLASRITSASISIWKGKWGARISKFAGVGLKPAEHPMLGMPVLTEVALGRATDHLYRALPKTARRELAALPEIVRRLEGDALKLRESIKALEDQLAAFERGGDALRDASRSALADDLTAARALAVDRLAGTVAALEGIRLDLLRLQMGSAPIESVTAALDAARQIGERIGESIAAQSEVEQLLRDSRSRTGTLASPAEVESDDDADTPVQGVPAARG